MDNKDQANSNSSRRRRIALGVLAFLVVAAIIVIPTCFATLRPETVPVVETRAEESLPSLIKVAPIGATGGAILIEYTELLEDNSTVFYYLTVRDLDFTTLEGVADASNLALYLTSAAEPTADDVLKNNLSVRLRHRRDLLAIDEDNAIRIGLVNSIDFPFRLPDSFLPGNFNGALFIEEKPGENNEASNAFAKTVSSASFTAIVDPERNIGSSTSAVTTTSSQPTQSPSRSPTESPTATMSAALASFTAIVDPERNIGSSTSAVTTTSSQPTQSPSRSPTESPTATMSAAPTATPTPKPSATVLPSRNPTAFPTTSAPSQKPTTESPTAAPTRSPTGSPSRFPTRVPSPAPTFGPTTRPSLRPTAAPSPDPTAVPTRSPQPTVTGFTPFPTATPSFHPTNTPTLSPTRNPTSIPTGIPTMNPTIMPTSRPTEIPSVAPTRAPTRAPVVPTSQPSTKNPTTMPSPDPTKAPTNMPSPNPTKAPTAMPSSFPTDKPTVAPTEALVDPASSQLPPLLFSDINGSYGIDGSINIDYVQDFRNGAIVDVARLRFDIPNLSNAPGPYLYLSKRPFSETRNGGLSDEDIFVPIDSGSEGQFNVKGRFDQFLDEIASVQDLQDYANGSWIVWCRPFGVWIGGGDISAV